MREIKFRAWDGGRMENNPSINCYCGPDVVGLANLNYGIESSEYPLMQYTGLKDKNGVEIFEGDILKLVKWNESSKVPIPGWKIGEVMYRHGAFRIHAYIVCEVAESCEIIGNIYKNPELLTK